MTIINAEFAGFITTKRGTNRFHALIAVKHAAKDAPKFCANNVQSASGRSISGQILQWWPYALEQTSSKDEICWKCGSCLGNFTTERAAINATHKNRCRIKSPCYIHAATVAHACFTTHGYAQTADVANKIDSHSLSSAKIDLRTFSFVFFFRQRLVDFQSFVLDSLPSERKQMLIHKL